MDGLINDDEKEKDIYWKHSWWNIIKISVGRYSVFYMFLEESNKVIIIRIIDKN